MSRWARTRWWGKWIGTIVCAVIAVMWVGSMWFFVAFTAPSGHAVGVAAGRASVGYLEYVAKDGTVDGKHLRWDTRRFGAALSWRFEFVRIPRYPSSFLWTFPLWFPLLLTLIPTTIAWRLDARARRLVISGRCTTCRYDLAGLPAAAPCPECGRARGASA